MSATATAAASEAAAEAGAVPSTTREDVHAALDFLIQKKTRFRTAGKAFKASLRDTSIPDAEFGRLTGALLFADGEMDRARRDFEHTLNSHVTEGLS